jgi:branched-chain amino acid transport system ATP-binding protein
MLQVDGVCVTIKGFRILRGISLELPAGGLMALVGRNGAGKTTTLKSIMGLLPITRGVVQLNGTDLVPVPGHRRALCGIGYMPEDRRLIGPLTVEDNIRMPAWASGLAHSDQRLAYIYEHMPEVAALAKRRASALSGGQQKMVALARAVMSGTKLLLLDEPFEGLSPAMGEKLAGAIQALQQGDLSVLIAESDVRRLHFAEKIYTIERGAIVQQAKSET